MQNEIVSIILPVYNAEQYIAECVDSVIKQSYSNWELIIIDDGSTDNTEKEINSFLQEDSRIKYYRIQNSGVSNARNYGLDKTSGKWIFFLDADDYLDENCLQKSISVSTTYNADIVVMSHYELDDLKNKCKKNNKFEQTELLNKDEIMQNFLMTNKIGWEIWGKLFRRDLLKKLYFNKSLRIGEDAVFLVSVLKRSSTLVLLKEYGYYYRLNTSSVMAQNFSDKNFDTIAAISKIYEEVEEMYSFEADAFKLKYYIWFLRNFNYKVTENERSRFNKDIYEIKNEIGKEEIKKAYNMLSKKYFAEYMCIKYFYTVYVPFIKKFCK